MSSSLGKRKAREEEDVKQENTKPHGSTLFVSNLPYTATSVDLQTLFSDLAPVRSAFVVTEHGTGVSKGVGYVSFSIREDAEAVYDKLSKEGVNLAGRSLRVQWAENKPKEKEKEKGEKVKKEKGSKEVAPPAPPRAHHPKAPYDPLAIRTIVVSGLPSSVDAKVLWKKFRKYQGAEKVEWPIKVGEGEIEDTAHVLFTTPSDALSAVNKLHAHVYKGSLLSVALKKRLDTNTHTNPSNTTNTHTDPNQPNPTTKKPTGKGGAAPSHANRLIVRNIPFNTTEQDLRAVFLKYGPIYSVHIPTTATSAPASASATTTTTATDSASGSPSTKRGSGETQTPRTRTRGFAFIWYLSKKDAERAVEGCNGTLLRAGIARGLVEGKQKRKKVRREEAKAMKGVGADVKAEAERGGVKEEEENENDQEEGEAEERIIAVDWALSKDKWEEEKAKMGDVEMGDASDSDAASVTSESDESEEEEDEEDEEEEDGVGLHEADSFSSEFGSSEEDGNSDSDENEDSDDEGSDSEEEQEEEEADVPVKPSLPTPEEGTTLFVRNVPFEATEDDLRTLFRAFGPLRYARITVDPGTGRSRGTGFACFWNKEDADRVVEVSEVLRGEMGSGGTQANQNTKKPPNPFSLPSILTPDPSSTLARSLVLQGRTLDVVRAVSREKAGRLKEEGEKRREKEDKRNLYLLREGAILPTHPSSSHLPPTDLARRTSSFEARKALLKSNPALYVSKTRLSVRQIPVFVTEGMLKRLAGEGMRRFEEEVREGVRRGLSVDEAAEDATEGVEGGDDEKDGGDAKRKKQLKSKPRPRGVKQSKIIRAPTRIDPLTGKGRSKGYGFIEMHTHADALRVLRWANNNPRVGEMWGEWWVGELEGMIRAEKAKAKSKSKSKGTGKGGEDEGKGQGQGEGERDESRIKRIEEEIERWKAQGAKGANGKGKSGGEGKGNLIVEFSIENVQVVKRRNEMQQQKGKEKGKERAGDRNRDKDSKLKPKPQEKEKLGLPKVRAQTKSKAKPDAESKPKPKAEPEETPEAEASAPPNKKPRLLKPVKPKSEEEEEKPQPTKPSKPGQTVGFLIGRKRKERKVGKGRRG